MSFSPRAEERPCESDAAVVPLLQNLVQHNKNLGHRVPKVWPKAQPTGNCTLMILDAVAKILQGQPKVDV